jgi:6-phosphogluconolactonase
VKNWELIPCPTDSALAEHAAQEWLDQVRISSPVPYLVALSGGRIAKQFFAAIAQRAKAHDLAHVHFFWADERCVPPEHAESNFLLAQKNLFEVLQISASQIHRIRGEDAPQVAAHKATADLTQLASISQNGWPILDMIFLGMGEDGHVASLFPNGADEASGAVYYPVVASKPPPNRITISYGVLSEAKNVWVLASGAGKEDGLRRSFAATGATPLGKVLASREMTRIFTDVKL